MSHKLNAFLVCAVSALLSSMSSSCVSLQQPGDGIRSLNASNGPASGSLPAPGQLGAREDEAFRAATVSGGAARVRFDSKTTVEEAIEVAVNRGGQTIEDARRLVTQRKQWPAAHRALESAIQDGIIKYDNIRLANAVALYQGSPLPASVRLFENLVSSGRPVARQMGWQVAAAMPSRALTMAIERELGRAISENDEATVLIPQMAVAVQANGMKSAYTMVRQGLMTTGQEAFALSMAQLDPERASSDFIDYLAIASPEELRQLTQNSVNVYTCLIALKHLQSHPAPLSHPHAEQLVYYAVSRNNALADLAQAAIEAYLPRDRAQVAIMMSRLPQWAQIAYVESARRHKTPAVTLLLGELKKISSSNDVVEEVDEVLR